MNFLQDFCSFWTNSLLIPFNRWGWMSFSLNQRCVYQIFELRVHSKYIKISIQKGNTLTMQSKDVLNPSSCWVPSGFPVLALGSHTTGVDKSKPTKQKSLTLIHRSMRLFFKLPSVRVRILITLLRFRLFLTN